ncbi:MAG: RNA polymerase sigma factor RpoD/SigA [Bacteroidota bacterium]
MRQLHIIKQVTNRENASLDKYLNEIGKVKLITVDEEVNLAQRIHNGDLNARNCLINANLRFVVSVAKQYQNKGMSLPDLINEGNSGLIIAAQRFDETRGFKFISYAVWWIRQSILQALAEKARIVRLPLNRFSDINKIKRTIAVLEQKYEREPTIVEITQALEMTLTDVTVAIKNAGHYISFDAPLAQDEESNMYDVFSSEETSGPDKELLTNSLKEEIERVVNTLTPREANIIRLTFGLNGKRVHTLGEIGEKYDLTRERVRQIKEKAIKRLQHISKSRVLETYLS